MRLIVITAILFFVFLNVSYPADFSEAGGFAKEFEQETKSKENKAQEEMEKSMWSLTIKERMGVATYKEKEDTVSSDYESFYSEVSTAAVNHSSNDIENTISFSWGQSVNDTETWNIGNVKYQTNDLDFYRINAGCSIGKILYSDRYKKLCAIPFLAYGFRYINFQRSDFVILNTITIRDVVNEGYYIHHLDLGIKFDYPISSKWDIEGFGFYGYPVYSQADNSILGKIKGGGGRIVNGNIDLSYKINEAWQLVLGGFVELQRLNGGTKGDVIWPDNDLNIYGGNLGARLLF